MQMQHTVARLHALQLLTRTPSVFTLHQLPQMRLHGMCLLPLRGRCAIDWNELQMLPKQAAQVIGNPTGVLHHPPL